MFYPQEVFEAQVQEFVAQGFSVESAVSLTREQEARDQEEYHQWRDEQDEIARQEEMYAEHNDSWYDDQYELDTDYA